MYFNILFLFQKTGRVLPLAKKYSHLLTYKFVLGARLQGQAADGGFRAS